MERLTTSKKVEFAIKDQGRNKTWLANQLGITRPVLYDRLKNNGWEFNEINKLKEIGLI